MEGEVYTEGPETFLPSRGISWAYLLFSFLETLTIWQSYTASFCQISREP
jgi:hypothetical protein